MYEAFPEDDSDPPLASGSHARQLIERFKVWQWLSVCRARLFCCALFFATRPIFVSFAVDNDCQEREESVKLDIISCFTELLRATVVIEGQAVPLTSISRSLNDSIGFGVGGGGSVPEVMSVARGYSVQAGVRAALLPPPRLVRQRSCFDSLEVRSLTWMGGQVGKWLRHVCFTASVLKDVALYCTRFVLQTLADSIVTAALKQLSGKDGKTKVAIWTMLRHLVQALGHKITPYFPKLLPAAEVRPYHHSSAWSYLPCKVLVTAVLGVGWSWSSQASMRDVSHTAIRLEALLFVRMLLDCNVPSAFHPYIAGLVKSTVQCSSDEWYVCVFTPCRARFPLCDPPESDRRLAVPCRYQIQAESLRCLGRIVVVLRLKDEDV